MTYRFNPRHLVICLSLSVFFSCKKEDASPNPTPDPPAEADLFSQVQGRWNAEFELPSGSGRSSSKQQGQDESKLAVVEFFADSSYVIAFANESMPLLGKFKPVNDSTITVSTFAGDISIANLKIANDSISFSFPTYQGSEETRIVKAAKAKALSISEANKALLYKNWLVEKDLADGAQFYQSASGLGDIKAYLYFSPQGTLMLKYKFEPNSNMPTGYPTEMAIFMNWKWHADQANTVVTYPILGDEMSMSAIKITSISATTLKVPQEYPGSQQPAISLVLTAQ